MFADGFLLRKPKEDEIWQTESTKVTCLVCCWRTEQERWMFTMRWQGRRIPIRRLSRFIRWKVVYNINPGNNEELKKRSQTLREYMIFVGYVNENLAKAEKGEKDYETAISDAVSRCIAEDILKEFLLERREDVQKSMMFDLTYEKQMENAKREWYNDGVEEGRAEGYSSGIAEGRAEGAVHHLVISVVKKVQKNKTLDQIADELEESIETIQPIYDIVKKHAPEYDVDAITTEVLETRENEKA